MIMNHVLLAAHIGVAQFQSAMMSIAADKPTWGDNPALTKPFLPAVWETLVMTGVATLVTVIFGLPLGLLVVNTSRHGLTPNRIVHQILGVIVNVGRSFPFIILLIAIVPLTRFLVGTTLGWKAAMPSLIIGAIPFFARLVETNVLAVSRGKIEAAQMMGASNQRIYWGVQVREALPALIQSVTVLAITLIGYSAMAGAVGAGGLGKLAINYGYNQFMPDVMLCAVVAIIIIVQVIQMMGDMISRLVDHR